MRSGGAVLAVVFLVCAVGSLYAQNGTVTGSVVEKGSRLPIPGVIVRLTGGPDSSVATGGSTDPAGQFRLARLSAGRYVLRYSIIGYRTPPARTVVVHNDSTLTLYQELEQEHLMLGEVVSTASRTSEKTLNAPAPVIILPYRDLADRQALTPIDHLQGVTGVDVVQKGIMQYDYVARGLNNVFNATMFTLTDNRMAGLATLRANVSYLMPQVTDDIERMELVLGPASALYGPNVTNGILHIMTKSPFSSPGTSISVAGGERGLFHGTLRHAAILSEAVAVKVSGQYFRAEDWDWNTPTTQWDTRAERFSGEARADFMLGTNAMAGLTAGVSQAVRTIDLTDNGAAQARNFRSTFLQARFVFGDLFAQLYMNANDAGDTYLLETDMKVVDNSKKYVAEIQHGVELADIQRFTYGANAFFTRPETGGTIFGRNEDRDNIDEYGLYLQSDTELLPEVLSLVLAGRVDWNSMLTDPVFSPRAGLVVHAAEKHTVRATYNRAYATPAPGDFFLDLLAAPDLFGIPGAPFPLRGTGVPLSGYAFERDPGYGPLFFSPFLPDPSSGIPLGQAGAFWDAAREVVIAQAQDPLVEQFLRSVPSPSPDQIGGVMGMLNLETGSFVPVAKLQDLPPLKPMINQTVELGYKGIFGERFQCTIDGYYSRIKDFVTTQQVFTPTAFLGPEDVAAYLQPYIDGLGLPPEQAAVLAEQLVAGLASVPVGTVSPREATERTEILLAPVNAGDISYWGIDVSLGVSVARNISLNGTYSYISDNYFPGATQVGDLSLNAPRHKASAGIRYREETTGLSADLRTRFVDGFRVRSAVYEGTVNPYTLVDMSLAYPLAFVPGGTLRISALNVLDHRHREFVASPEIGRLVRAQLAYQF